MNNRNLQFDESAGPSSATSSILYECRVMFTGTEGDVYAIIATTCANSGSNDFLIGVENATASVTYHDQNIFQSDIATDYHSLPMLFTVTVPAGGAMDLGLYIYDNDAMGVTLRNSGLYAFKLLDRDEVLDASLTSSDLSDTTTNTTFEAVSGSELVFTVPTAGDYLILASAQTWKNTTAHGWNMQLSVTDSTPTTTTYCDMVFRMKSVGVSNQRTYGALKRVTLPAGSTTIKLEHKVLTSGTATALDWVIFALRCEDFPKVHYAETSGAVSTSSTTYIENTNIEDDYGMAAYQSLILSYGIHGRTTATNESAMKSSYDGTTFHESSNESIAASSGSEFVHYGAKVETPVAGGHTIEQYFNRDATGLGTAFLGDSAIAGIQMQDNATIKVMGGKIFGGKLF